MQEEDMMGITQCAGSDELLLLSGYDAVLAKDLSVCHILSEYKETLKLWL